MQYYPIIDAHHHFWKFDPVRDKWITDEMKVLQTDYLPADIESIYNQKQYRVLYWFRPMLQKMKIIFYLIWLHSILL